MFQHTSENSFLMQKDNFIPAERSVSLVWLQWTMINKSWQERSILLLFCHHIVQCKDYWKNLSLMWSFLFFFFTFPVSEFINFFIWFLNDRIRKTQACKVEMKVVSTHCHKIPSFKVVQYLKTVYSLYTLLLYIARKNFKVLHLN